MPPVATDSLLDDLRSRLGRGRDHPLSAKVLARDLDVSTRTVGALVAELIDRGELIGSTCDGVPGYFLIETRTDLEVGTRHIVARARASFARVGRLRRAAEQKFGRDHVLTLFDLEEVSHG